VVLHVLDERTKVLTLAIFDTYKFGGWTEATVVDLGAVGRNETDE
jgi:hypothetical protein